MWALFAVLSALFAGATAILAKCGLNNINSDAATALRTVVVLIFAWTIVFIVGSYKSVVDINTGSLVFLILSGLSTGASWLCYFKALSLGDVNKIAPIDKSSTVLTVILAFIILGEDISLIKIIGAILVLIGTFFMIEIKKGTCGSKSAVWVFYAVLSAIFASITAILGKIGISGVESNLGTAIRTTVVLAMAWAMVFVTKSQSELKNIGRKNLIFILLSGTATGASWLCYYKALQDGPASAVVPIDKLSILVTVAFSYIFLHEKLSKKSIFGLALMTVGTVFLALQ